MTPQPAFQTRSPVRAFRGWAMACAALAVCATGVMATSPAAAAAAASAPNPAAEAAAKAFPALTRAQVDALLASPEKVVVLDVRRADELSTIGGFPAFLNIQVADLERYLSYIPKDRQVLAVSNRAHRAQAAAVLLASRGFKVAGAAGALDYADQGGTLVGKAAPAATAAAR